MSPGLVIGLDVGTKTIGLARYDPRTGMASPWTTLSRRGVKKDVAQLRGALASLERPAEVLVVGLPLELDGAEGRSCRLARQVGDALAAATGLPLHYCDERYSTVEAERRLYEAGYSAREQRAIIDQAAAVVILEDWVAGQASDAPG